MEFGSIADSSFTTWVLIPLFIFLARIFDVSLGTMRILFVSRGLRYLAPLVGFFEVIIWLLAIRSIMQNLNNIVCFLAYGGGFAMGNFIGILIEKKLAVGQSVLRIITNRDATRLIQHLRKEGFGVTSLDAEGIKGKVHIIFMIIRRADMENVSSIIQKFNPNAFYTVEDIRVVTKGIFPEKNHRYARGYLNGPFKFLRKGK